jgi:hypothetical protein
MGLFHLILEMLDRGGNSGCGRRDESLRASRQSIHDIQSVELDSFDGIRAVRIAAADETIL